VLNVRLVANQNQTTIIISDKVLRTSFFLVLTVLLATLTSALDRNLPFEVKVLSAESHEFQAPPVAPSGCNWREFSAYCHSASPETYVENTMTVQAPDGKSLQIACTVYNQWSHCADLPINQTFQAKLVKHGGLEIRYVDQQNKVRKQVYQIVSEDTSHH
jgi:hypothetical protein